MSGPDIALFGTSADPPTLGHRALLEGLLRLYPQVATWASDNPLKRHAAPLELRTALLAALVEAIDDPRLELVQALSSPWTVETLDRAHRRWPQSRAVLVIGSDLVEQLPRWRRSAEWLPGCPVAIAPRQGWPLEQSAVERLRQLGAQPQILELEVPASASSGLRACGDSSQLPAELLPLLRQQDPYGLVPSTARQEP